MPTDQVESLTRERRNANRIIADLPVLDNAVQDLLAKDHVEEGNPVVRVVLTSMAWATYIMALGVMVLLTRAILTH